MSFFKMFFPKKMVGVDIGTSSVKIVELSLIGQGKKLENYGQVASDAIYKESLSKENNGSRLPASHFVAAAVRAILDEARIKTKAAIFSVPDFSTFCTSFDIPQMSQKEIPEAIRYNAVQYITLPINEVTLDWRVVPNSKQDKGSLMKVFLVAVPNQIIHEYQTIARDSGLQLYALEAEAFSLTRALVKNNAKNVCVVDIGVQSSTINIVERGFLRRSYSFNFYSSQLTRAIALTLGVASGEAEKIKNQEGLISERRNVSETLYPLIDPLVAEIKSIIAEFFQKEQKQVDEVYLAGGTANLPGLKEYFAESLQKEISVPNCFSGLLYPPILEENLRSLSPSFSVAVGAAIGGLESLK